MHNFILKLSQMYYGIRLCVKGLTGQIVALSDRKTDNRNLLLKGVERIFEILNEGVSRFVEMIENNRKDTL